MRGAALRLESFAPAAPAPAPASPGPGPAEVERTIARARSEGHARGYEEGAAAAMAAQDSELRLLLAALAEALDDQALAARAARAALERAAGPLFCKIAAAISPALAREGIGREVAERAGAILARAPETRLTIAAPPDLAPRLADFLARHGLAGPEGRTPAAVRADPAMGGLGVRLFWGAGIDEIDPGAAAAAVAAALADWFGKDGRDGQAGAGAGAGEEADG